MASYSLKYIFQAVFKDGSIYTQNPEDAPVISPTGSSFSDIKDRLDDIQEFRLCFLDEKPFALVNLETGLFEVGGVPFCARDPRLNLPDDAIYRLIYFRQVKHSRVGENLYLHPVQYHIGWQTTINDVNHQQTISVT